MNRLRLCFYGDDFTGSTDALEQLTVAGLRTVLFIRPPTRRDLAAFGRLEAVGVAGRTRALPPDRLARELRPALKALKTLGAPHVHYKVCSTFDSSPGIGSIGRVIDVARAAFPAPFIPLVVAAPPLGRYCVFGNLFARYGIGSNGNIHRLDRHPSARHHPVTPMKEADLQRHLAKQTSKAIALFDILHLTRPPKAADRALRALLATGPEVILFDALDGDHLRRIGRLIDARADPRRPLFSVGSSGLEMALTRHWNCRDRPRAGRWKGRADAVRQLLVGSGSCSPVTAAQIAWALKHGFREVVLDGRKLIGTSTAGPEIGRAARAAVRLFNDGYSVVIHTTPRGSRNRLPAVPRSDTAALLGGALGRILRRTISETRVARLCIAGGDTSSYAARSLGITALEMIAPLTPGAPLCRTRAPRSPADGLEIVFKGGQVGDQEYFDRVRRGRK